MCLTRASTYWKKNHETKIADLINKRKEGDKLIQPLQCEQATPVMVGADVSTLYPSMDNIGSAEMAAKSIRESEVKFNNIDYQKLATYLTLTLGKEGLTEAGLGHVVTLKINKKCNARSLAAASNKKEENWVHLDQSKLDEETKRDMIALMVKIAVLVMIESTFYSFGGELYRQLEGTGIGLRGSACLAKLLMGQLDQLWAMIQNNWGLISQLYLRYIDDLRIYLYPISKGWTWVNDGWSYNEGNDDARSDIKRTCEEIGKTLNSCFDFLNFTTESEEDFGNSYLPTLDVQIKVRCDGSIEFMFFSKPMSNNILIQKGTALPKNVIFASLRQDLIRRLINCSEDIDIESLIGKRGEDSSQVCRAPHLVQGLETR